MTPKHQEPNRGDRWMYLGTEMDPETGFYRDFWLTQEVGHTGFVARYGDHPADYESIALEDSWMRPSTRQGSPSLQRAITLGLFCLATGRRPLLEM